MSKRIKDFWKNHIAAYSESDLTQAEYCRMNNINANYLSKLLRIEIKDNPGNAFVQIKPAIQDYMNDNLRLTLSDKYIITIPDNFSNETLKRILDILEARL
jgi:hypothetical protein